MDNYFKYISNFSSVTFCSAAVYLGYRVGGLNLPIFLYIALGALVVNIVTSLFIRSKKKKKTGKNKKVG